MFLSWKLTTAESVHCSFVSRCIRMGTVLRTNSLLLLFAVCTLFQKMLKLNKSSTCVTRFGIKHLFLFISLAAVPTYMYWKILDLDEHHVIVCHETHETNASFSTNLKHVHQHPSSPCDNILGNLTNGRWVVTAPGQTAYYDDLLLRYWQKRGILEKLKIESDKSVSQNNNFAYHV